MKNFLFIIILLPTLYINYLVFDSYVIQYSLLQEFNSQKYKEQTTAFFNKLNTKFPNIGVTTIPIDQLLSKYYFLSGDYEKALSLIEKGEKANPYLKTGSLFKAEIYDHLGIVDSSYFYSKDAFQKMPRTPRHFLFYSKSLVKKSLLDELLSAYKIIENEKNPQYHNAFIVALAGMEKDNDSLRKIVLNIKEKFISSELVRISADHYLYGIENIKKSIEYSKKANDFFAASMFNEAIQNFKKASELNPGDYTNNENIAFLYIQQKEFERAIPILFELLKNTTRLNKGKAEFLLGLSLINLDRIEEGCKYMNISKKFNFPESYIYISRHCN